MTTAGPVIVLLAAGEGRRFGGAQPARGGVGVDRLQLGAEMVLGRSRNAGPGVDRPSGARVIQRGAGDGGQN